MAAVRPKLNSWFGYPLVSLVLGVVTPDAAPEVPASYLLTSHPSPAHLSCCRSVLEYLMWDARYSLSK
jgi:hypothetical protein